MAINWRELFPGRWSGFIFISYMILFINQGIIVTWSQSDGNYAYNIVAVVLLTEILKLLVSIVLYCWDNTPTLLINEIARYRQIFFLYMVPSFLYCLYNNLAFVNLAVFDPTTYYLLLQFRVVVTGIIFQIVFKKILSTKQWISLVILTIGCMMKHMNLDFRNVSFASNIDFNINTLFILIQVICSCLAGVYNEYLLKGQGANINIFLQNIFMYIDSSICNILILMIQGNPQKVFDNIVPTIFLQPKVIAIIINNAAIGIITSFFLKNLNSILKTFASALELIFTAILCWLLFNIPIYMNTVLAIAMVSYSVILYSQNPVQNVHVKIENGNSNEKESLFSTGKHSQCV